MDERSDAGGGTREWRVTARRHELGIDRAVDSGADVLTVTGDLDAQTHDQLRQLFKDDAHDAGFAEPHLVIDLSGVAFIDSSGLGALVVANKAATARGAALRLVANTPAVVRLLTVTRLDQSIPTHATRDEALAAVR